MNETFITKTDSNQEERLRALEGSYARRILEDSCARAPSIELTSLNQSRGNDLEEFLRKGMQTNSQQSNFPIMQGLTSQCALYSCMQGFSSILSACRHVKIGGSQLKITRNTGQVTAARGNMYAPVMREYEINAKVLSSSIRVPFGLLQDSGAEILKIFTQENANTLANIMEGEIISGNSPGITGILNTPEVLTYNVDAEFDTQHLFALLSQLPAEHYHNKKWIMSRLAYNKLLLSEDSC